MTIYRISYLFLSIGMMFSCNEYDTTIKEPLELVTYSSSLNADGTSTMMITAKSKKYMLASQTIQFSTTDGSLFALPVTGFSEGVKTISVQAMGDSASVLLRASRLPRTKVFIGLKVNNFITTKIITFNRICPTALMASLSDATLNHSTNDRPLLHLELINELSEVSDSTRIKLTVDKPGLIELPAYTFINRKAAVNVVALNDSIDTAIIQVDVVTNGCPVLTSRLPIRLAN